MRLVFFAYRGTIGARCLHWLLSRVDAEVAAVVTWPDYLHPEISIAVKEVLYDAHLPLYQPRDVDSPAFVERLRRLEPDLLVSMYFGKLLRAPLLAVPRHGCVNIHNSLLPKYRGQAPSIWAIVNGDLETGQTVHYLDEGMDSGDIIAQKSLPISEHDTGYTLGQKLEDVGVHLFQEVFPAVLSGAAPRVPQNDSLATYCRAPRPGDARIDWARPAPAVHNFVRAFTQPMGGAFTRLGGKTVRVWDTAVLDDEDDSGKGALCLALAGQPVPWRGRRPCRGGAAGPLWRGVRGVATVRRGRPGAWFAGAARRILLA